MPQPILFVVALVRLRYDRDVPQKMTMLLTHDRNDALATLPSEVAARWVVAGLSIGISLSLLLVDPWAAPGYFQGFLYTAPKSVGLGFGLLIAALAALTGDFSPRVDQTVSAFVLTWFDLAVAGYFVVAVASHVSHWPVSPPGLELLSTEALGALFFLFTARFAATEARRRVLLWTVLGACVVVALLATAEALLPGLKMLAGLGRRPLATLGSRNSVALCAAVALPLAWLLPRGRLRYARLPLLTLLSMVVVLTRARGVWLALLVVAATSLVAGDQSLRRFGWRRWRVVAAVLFGAAAAVLMPWPGLNWAHSSPYLNSVSRLVDWQHGTGRERLDQHRLGFELVRRQPWLGVGPGNWRRDLPTAAAVVPARSADEVATWLVPRSDFLRLLTESGVCGFLFGLASLAALGEAIWRARRNGVLSREQGALGISLALILVASAFDFQLGRPQNLAVVGLAVGSLRPHLRPVASAWWRQFERRLRPAPLVMRRLAVGAVGFFLTVCGADWWSARLAGHANTLAAVQASLRLFPVPLANALTLLRIDREQVCDHGSTELAAVQRLLPFEVRLHVLQAACFERAGDSAAAQAAYDEALALAPNSPALRYERERLARASQVLRKPGGL